MLLRFICLAIAGSAWLVGWCGEAPLRAQPTPQSLPDPVPWFWRRSGLDVWATASHTLADHGLRLRGAFDRRQLPYTPLADGQWRTSLTLTLSVLDAAGGLLWPLTDSLPPQAALADTLPPDLAAHVHDLWSAEWTLNLPPQLSLPAWGWVRLRLQTPDGRQAQAVVPYARNDDRPAPKPTRQPNDVAAWSCWVDAAWAGNFFQSKHSRRPALLPPEAHCIPGGGASGPLLGLRLWHASDAPEAWVAHWPWPPTAQSGPMLDSLASDALTLVLPDRLWAKMLQKHGHTSAPLAYWQQITGQSATAHNLWAEWRRRVQVANVAFAEALPSLRTDRALVWLLLGPPDAITWHPEYMLWFYEGRGTEAQGPLAGALQLMFRAQLVMPGVVHYDLVRQPTLEPIWYTALDQWRRGLRP
jgi:GWxTD domain-containing protein